MDGTTPFFSWNPFIKKPIQEARDRLPTKSTSLVNAAEGMDSIHLFWPSRSTASSRPCFLGRQTCSSHCGRHWSRERQHGTLQPIKSAEDWLSPPMTDHILHKSDWIVLNPMWNALNSSTVAVLTNGVTKTRIRLALMTSCDGNWWVWLMQSNGTVNCWARHMKSHYIIFKRVSRKLNLLWQLPLQYKMWNLVSMFTLPVPFNLKGKVTYLLISCVWHQPLSTEDKIDTFIPKSGLRQTLTRKLTPRNRKYSFMASRGIYRFGLVISLPGKEGMQCLQMEDPQCIADILVQYAVIHARRTHFLKKVLYPTLGKDRQQVSTFTTNPCLLQWGILPVAKWFSLQMNQPVLWHSCQSLLVWWWKTIWFVTFRGWGQKRTQHQMDSLQQ